MHLIKNRKHLLLSDINLEESEVISVSDKVSQVETPFGVLFFDEADAIFGKRTNIIFADKNELKFPLTIRKYQEGDVFYPLGMTGKKKVSKYFKDEKYT